MMCFLWTIFDFLLFYSLRVASSLDDQRSRIFRFRKRAFLNFNSNLESQKILFQSRFQLQLRSKIFFGVQLRFRKIPKYFLSFSDTFSILNVEHPDKKSACTRSKQ